MLRVIKSKPHLSEVILPKSERLVILHHLGLGDQILCNAITRTYCKFYKLVVLLCKTTNIKCIKRMFQDIENIEFLEVDDDIDAQSIASQRKEQGWDVLLSGVHCLVPLALHSDFNYKSFDECFYKRSNVPFDWRWTHFKTNYNSAEEERVYKELNCQQPYVFVHDDLHQEKLALEGFDFGSYQVVRPVMGLTDVMFDYKKVIENAKEIHCIASSFACWIDIWNPPPPKKFHPNGRPNGNYCQFRSFKTV